MKDSLGHVQAQQSYDDLFHCLDKNHDGRIDIQELIDLFHRMNIETSTEERVALARVS
jgi:Ca2+-binding EF-hand superfamily protein